MEATQTHPGTSDRVPASETRLQKASRLWSGLFACAIVILLVTGFLTRDESSLSPADGTGYALGIIGGSLMLLLLFYPMRKSMRVMQSWGPIKYWFQLHMLFGVLGPVMILFHSNFNLGSTNSNLALFSMLIVASSGLVGRYLYAKIHLGLYGHKISLKELRQELKISKGNLGHNISLSPNLVRALKQHEKFMLKQRNFIVHFLFLPVIYFRSRLARAKIKHTLYADLRKQARKNNWDKQMLHAFMSEANSYLREYFLFLNKTGHLSVYVRLFSLWHVVHMPLFILLVITGIVHVFAVHMY